MFLTRARFRPLVSLARVMVVVAIGGCADASASPPAIEDRDVTHPGAVLDAVSQPPHAPERARIEVAGLVTTDLENPPGARVVTLLDARSELHETMTDDSGGFAVANVAPPYDLAVSPQAGSALSPVVYLGLEQRAPYIGLAEREGPAPTPPCQILRLAIAGCSPNAEMMIVTRSESGAGAMTARCGGGSGVGPTSPVPITVEVQHGWRTVWVPPTELVNVYVLVANAERTSFAYTEALGVTSAAPGETTEVTIPTPSEVAMTAEPVEIGSLGGAASFEAWTLSTEVALDVSTIGAPMSPSSIAAVPVSSSSPSTPVSFILATVPTASTAMRIPLVPNATLRATLAATYPASDFQAQGGFSRTASVWSGMRTLPTSAGVAMGPIDLELFAGPDIVRPEVDGVLSRRGRGFKWKVSPGARELSPMSSSSTPSLVTLVVADSARSVVRYRVVTNGDAVTLDRLSLLGLPKLLPGAHMLDLSVSMNVAIDDFVSPDAHIRGAWFDVTRRGGSSDLRIPFEVTP